MTTIPDNAKLTQASAQVILEITRVTENWTKQVKLLTTPKTNANRDYDNPKVTTQFIDLGLKAEHRLTFDGMIGKDSVNRSLEGSKNYSGVTITDAYDMKQVLKTMFFIGDPFTINWDGNDYLCNSDKFEITWSVNDKDEITSYSIKFTVIVGEDL